MKLSSFFYLIVLISGLLIPTQQSHAFFFDFDFSGNSDYYGWDSPYNYSRYQPYYWGNYDSYYHNRYNPYWNRWSQPYRNRWSESYWNRCICSCYEPQNYGYVKDSDLSTTDTNDIK